MPRLRGRGLGVGMALGTAAIVKASDGIPLLPEPPERIAQSIALRQAFERPDVILVAADYHVALTVARLVAWGQVVGIAAENASDDAPVPDFPAVVGLPDVLRFVEAEMLLLVDADRGILLADPEGLAIAQYQADNANISPKRRYYLEEKHLPAQTLDGRTIEVITEAGAASAGSAADAFFLSLQLDSLPFGSGLQDQKRLLRDAVNAAPGKPLIVSVDASVPAALLVETAAHVALTVTTAPYNEEQGTGIAEFRDELAAVDQERCDNDLESGLPRIGAELGLWNEEDWPAGLDQAAELVGRTTAVGISRLFLFPAVCDRRRWQILEVLIAAANASLTPAIVYVPGMTSDEQQLAEVVERLIGAGAAGIMVKPADVDVAKSLIRERNSSECREELMRYLQQEDGVS